MFYQAANKKVKNERDENKNVKRSERNAKINFRKSQKNKE